MSVPFFDRCFQLVLAFAISDSGLAWECSLCHKLFSLTADEAMARQSFVPPDHLVEEFHQHQCGIVLSRNFEVVQLEREIKTHSSRR